MKVMNKKKSKRQKKQTIDTLLHHTNKTLRLHLEGVLNINRARELKEVVHNALQSADRIIVNPEKAREYDVSLLQILCSAHRTAARDQKMFELSKNCPKELLQLAEETGFLRSKGCSFDTCGSCLWKKIPA